MLSQINLSKVHSIGELQQQITQVVQQNPALMDADPSREERMQDRAWGFDGRDDYDSYDGRDYGYDKRNGGFMSAANDLLYSPNGALKSYDDGWDSWAKRYGTGNFNNSQFKSADVYDGVYYGKKYFAKDSDKQKLFAAADIAAKQPGTEIVLKNGKTYAITKEESRDDLNSISHDDAHKAAHDKEARHKFFDKRYDEHAKKHGATKEDMQTEAYKKNKEKYHNQMDSALDVFDSTESVKPDPKNDATVKAATPQKTAPKTGIHTGLHGPT